MCACCAWPSGGDAAGAVVYSGVGGRVDGRGGGEAGRGEAEARQIEGGREEGGTEVSGWWFCAVGVCV